MILPSSLFFFLKEGERAASCDLRWMQRLIAAVALAMARRNVRRSVPMIFQARSFLSLPLGGWGDRLRLARVQGRAAAVAILTRPTPGAIISTRQPTDCFAIVYPIRALFPGGDGEQYK